MASDSRTSSDSRSIWAADLLAAALAVLDLRPFDLVNTLSRGRHNPSWNEGQVHRFIQIHEGSVRALSIAILPCESSLFVSSKSPILLGRYHWTGQWLLCRIFSVDGDGSYSVVWQDGFLQIGASEKDLRRLSPSLDRRIRRELGQMMEALRRERLEEKVPTSPTCGAHVAGGFKSAPVTVNGLNVWEASKRGDMETTLAIIDSGAASPNEVELLDVKETAYRAGGRTPLYWACFGGHVELVRELLLRGGEDHDGAAYCAVTTREAANDQRDILFDPDTGVYSDFVDYVPDDAEPRKAKKSDDALLIRALLVAAKSAKSTHAESLILRLPKKLYREPRKECIVCLVNSADTVALPCGHVACCWLCVRKIRKRSEGCPLCRAPMLAVERSAAGLEISDTVTVVS